MKYRKLGKTDLDVSVICLGTMTFGQQNTESEGHEQLDFALGQGINFVDTAEMYSVPGRKETQGSTERIIGTWLKKTGRRHDIILATKVTGPSAGLTHISPNLGFSRSRILEAIDLSLSRLQTDFVDLYQLHWPERNTNKFGVRGYSVHDAQWLDNFEETLETLNELIRQGKIRHWGLSNETPWGVMRIHQICRDKNYPLPVSIQNPYNLLNRTFEIGLAEIAIREHMGLLAYSPMAFGLLSGKYHEGKDTASNRLNQFKNMARYNSRQSYEAASRYKKIAEEAGLTSAQMSLAYVHDRPFVTSTIIGATDLDQLRENIESIDITLTADIINAIDSVYTELPNPAP